MSLQILLWVLLLIAKRIYHANGFTSVVVDHRHPSVSRIAAVTTTMPILHHKNNGRVMSTSSGEEGEAKSSTSNKPKFTLLQKIGCFYGLLSAMVGYGIRQGKISPLEATVGAGLLWLGYLLAISFTEAWVKFRAPFLPRHYGLDVGRTVFPVLNAIELALCSTLWMAQFGGGVGFVRSRGFLSVATATLISQVFYFTPKLVLMGKHVIYEAFSGTSTTTWTAKQKELFKDLSVEVETKPRPPAKLHLAYVLAELIKLIYIGAYVLKCYKLS